MKLDEGIQDQKLSLDITPLIDIVFLLVLFFAVSTSFISGEDLAVLVEERDTLAVDKKKLITEVAAKTQAIDALEGELEQTKASADELRDVVASLEQRSMALKASLEDSAAENRSLEQQLKDALHSYESLTLELESAKTEEERLAEQERLLRVLLLERADQNAELQAELGAAQQHIETQKDEHAEQLEKERMLQALLAEKAAKYEDLEVKLVKAGQQVSSLQSTVTALEGETTHQARDVRELETTILRLKADLAKFREVAKLDQEQVEQILAAQQQLQDGLDPLLKQNQVGIKREKQKLTLQLSDQILFDSGSADLKPGGFEVLRTVGDVIKDRIGNLEVQIGGHTDNVPISSREGPLSTNWGLSAARAVNVVRFLETEVGIGPQRLQAVGYGEHRPVASNETVEGRALNRRIEIVLVPR